MAKALLKWAAACLLGSAVANQGGCSTERARLPGGTTTDDNASKDFAEVRRRMVERQLRLRDITDERVLAAMQRIPRHEFVPPEMKDAAYEDSALPLALGQTVSQPYIVAFMTQALQLRGTERVLEIGTGSGYQAAVLAELSSHVYTIEILPELTARARTVLNALGYRNISFRVGDGYQGWPEEAPFDAIIVTAAPDHVPEPLTKQLKPGGRIILPVGRFEQELVIIDKTPSGLHRRSSIPVRFVPMTGRSLEGAPRDQR